jgi:hypothetical protein
MDNREITGGKILEACICKSNSLCKKPRLWQIREVVLSLSADFCLPNVEECKVEGAFHLQAFDN